MSPRPKPKVAPVKLGPPKFPTHCERVDVECPVCGRTDVARLVTVICPNVASVGRTERQGSPVPDARGVQSLWLQMPAGWAHALPLNWYECRGLRSGLARCPECLPKPNEG